MASWERVTGHLSELGEGPVWDAAAQKIIWVDILKGNIHWFHPQSNKFQMFQTGQMVGAVAIRKAGGLVAALQNGFAEISLEKGTVKTITDPEPHLNNNRFNDGKCDPAGRFWAGTMGMSGDTGAGNLYTLEQHLSVSVKIKGVSCSNGMAWSPDHATFYYIDTPTRQVTAYDYDISTGSINNKRTIITVPEEYGYPDGMTIDAEGMLWIALWNGWGVERWDPYTGQLLHRILLSASKITSCTFGGGSLEDLYITSARTGLTEQELAAQPLAGALFVVKNSGFRGLWAHEF